MYDYLTLGAATKKYAAKEYPSPSKVWSTLNKAEKAAFDRMMRDKNSATYKAVIAGRKAHMTLETRRCTERCIPREVAGDLQQRDCRSTSTRPGQRRWELYPCPTSTEESSTVSESTEVERPCGTTRRPTRSRPHRVSRSTSSSVQHMRLHTMRCTIPTSTRSPSSTSAAK